MKDFVNEPCGWQSGLNSSTSAQASHFIARFKRAMRDMDSFYVDNLGNVRKDQNARTWKIYDTFDQMIEDNRDVISSGNITHYFSFLRSQGVEAFAVAKVK